MSKKTIKVAYKEPLDYFPKELREKYKLGEFADKDEQVYNNCGGIQPIVPLVQDEK